MIVRKQTQTCIRTIKLYNVRIIQTQSNIFLLILEYYTLDLEGELKITS